jgi:hypothetical protein
MEPSGFGPEKAPAVKRRESPGRKGRKISPVSQKTIVKSIE